MNVLRLQRWTVALMLIVLAVGAVLIGSPSARALEVNGAEGKQSTDSSKSSSSSRPGMYRLSKMGRHFTDGDCKKAVRWLRQPKHWQKADVAATDQLPDNIVSVGDFMALADRRVYAAHLILTHARYRALHNNLPMGRAVFLQWFIDDKARTTILNARMATYFVDHGWSTQEFTSLETAKHHNAPDDKVSWGDTGAYLDQENCTRGG